LTLTIDGREFSRRPGESAQDWHDRTKAEIEVAGRVIIWVSPADAEL
jgi:hypothetical protein